MHSSHPTIAHADSPRGFTLMELLVVVCLMALLSVTASLMVRVPLANAQLHDAISRLQVLDAMARDRAGRRTRTRIVFDLKSQSARLLDDRDRELSAPTKLAHGLQFLEFGGISQSPTADRVIRYDEFATSPTYGVKIGVDQRHAQWLVVLGMTGQSYVFDDDDQNIHAILHPERYHAD